MESQNDQPPHSNDVVERILRGFRKEYLIIGNGHIKAWQAWLVLGLVVGITTGVILVSNRFGEVAPTGAQVAPPPPAISVSQTSGAVDRYGIYELTIAHDDSLYANPWEDVSVSIILLDPSGNKVTIDGFYYNTDTWKARFSPPAAGAWRWDLTLANATGSATASGAFTVAPSTYPGFVRKHPTNPFRLVFDDGSLFPAIGLQDCHQAQLPQKGWIAAGQQVDISSYMATYGAPGAGFNLFRLGVDNCSFKLWQTISTDGNRYLVNEGLMWDEIVDAARYNGLRLWMTVFDKPVFPNAANNLDEKAAVERYLRYVVARYGAHVDIWELTNEAWMNLGYLSNAWIDFTAGYIRSIDPHRRMITTSLEKPQHPAIDLNTPHWYEPEPQFLSDLRTSQQIALYKKSAKKPVLFGEQGNGFCNWDEGSATRMRLRSWTAFFEEGTLVFWNTSFSKTYCKQPAGPANLYLGPQERGYIRVLQNFVAGVEADVQRVPLAPADLGVRAYGLQSSQGLRGYLHHFIRFPPKQVSANIPVNLPYRATVTFIDPATGGQVGTVQLSSGPQILVTPPFAVDLAFTMRP